MNKTRIGVLIKDYKRQEGGAYSYNNALIEGIERFNFHEDLEFVFIAIGEKIDGSSPKNTYSFDPEKLVKKQYFFLSLLYRIARWPVLNFFPVSEKIEASYKKRYCEKIKEQLIKHGVDILYSPTPLYLDLDYPTVNTHWDIGHKSTYVFPELIYNYEFKSRKAYYSDILPKSFAIFCESEAGRKELCDYEGIHMDRVYSIPIFPGNIVDFKLSKEGQLQILNKFNVSYREFFIYPAQFWAHKNHFNLIMAFHAFSLKYPGVKLILSGGDKGNLSYIKQVVTDLNLQEKIHFPGFISDAELYTFYKNAISLVMPTLLGPTNMPPLEAQALGCPVICSDFEGHREGLKENAIYIDPLDKNAIFQAMEETYLKTSAEVRKDSTHKTISDALKAIEQAFLKLSLVRKTFPLDI